MIVYKCTFTAHGYGALLFHNFLQINAATCSYGQYLGSCAYQNASPWKMHVALSLVACVLLLGSAPACSADLKDADNGVSKLVPRMAPSGPPRGNPGTSLSTRPPSHAMGRPILVAPGRNVFIAPTNTGPVHLSPLGGCLGVVVVPTHSRELALNARIVGSLVPSAPSVHRFLQFVANNRHLLASTNTAYVFVPQHRSPAQETLIGAVLRGLETHRGMIIVRRAYQTARGATPEQQSVTAFYPDYVCADNLRVGSLLSALISFRAKCLQNPYTPLHDELSRRHASPHASLHPLGSGRSEAHEHNENLGGLSPPPGLAHAQLLYQAAQQTPPPINVHGEVLPNLPTGRSPAQHSADLEEQRHYYPYRQGASISMPLWLQYGPLSGRPPPSGTSQQHWDRMGNAWAEEHLRSRMQHGGGF